ncbi:cytochrome P450 [Parafrankia sp. EAN1pec]|uniref:cytochrome P450 n=1 Tax=Parafrankia sp. (strain EAN1pec) TaxID=298653 RepID=UPI00005411BE|nr:cytochrome P450 [Frankia sp. EAN1pec]
MSVDDTEASAPTTQRGYATAPTLAGFSHAANERLNADPWGELDRLRDESPTFRSDMPNPLVPGASLWYLLDYESVYTALRDWETFSNVGSAHPFSDSDPYSMIPGELDPPDHTKFRRPLNAHFSPGAIRALEPDIRRTAVELIESFKDSGQCDFVTDFALHFPTRVFERMFGVPLEDHDQLTAWVHTFGQQMATQTAIDKAVAAEQEVLAYLGKKLDEREQSPREDLLGAIAFMEVDGARISRKEQVAVAYLMFQAGMDTVASQLGWSFRHLAENEVDRQAILADPKLIPSTVEELLRSYDILSHTMIVAKDVEFNGCPMKKGDRVVTMISAANRDPNEFPDPDTFDVSRKPNRHMAFGVGPHRCIGAHLARIELNIALEEWHQRIPNYKVAEGAEFGQSMKWAVTSMESLPLEWDVEAVN